MSPANLYGILMIEFYSQIRMVHIWAISISGILFFLRAAFSIIGHEWPRNFAIRLLVYLVDITLLTAAGMLWTMLPAQTFENGWLNLKLALVVIYILSGFAAMSRKLSTNKRVIFYVFSAIIYINIIGIARAHNMGGWLYIFNITT